MLKTFSIGGVHPHENKLSAHQPIITAEVPAKAVILLGQHIGAPAKPVVAKGDVVKVGTRIAEPAGFVSAAIHSSVSGKVAKIDTIVDASGYAKPAIFIDVEGDEWEESIDRTETFKIMCSLEPSCCLTHCRNVQFSINKPCIQPSLRHREFAIQNAVLICLAAVLIARMPVRRNLAGTLHDNILRQTLIQCKRNLIRRHARRRIENCHVSQRMDAGIRAACAGHCDLLPQKRGKMAVQHFLDRDSVGLHLPSFIIRAVVRHGHFYTFYLFLQTISPCSFIAVMAQRFCTE